MDIRALFKSFSHILVAAYCRENTEFYLAVIGIEKSTAFTRNEEFTHIASYLLAHGDILHIGFGGAYSSRAGLGLFEYAVYPAVGFYFFQQTVNIGGAEFCKGAVFKHKAYNRVLIGKFFKNFGVGGITRLGFLLCGKSQFFKEDFAQLFW